MERLHHLPEGSHEESPDVGTAGWHFMHPLTIVDAQ